MRFYKLCILLTMLLSCCYITSCSTVSQKKDVEKQVKEMKSIIIYFTHSGNTANAARQLSKVVGAKAIQIKPVQPYSAEDVDWEDENSRCTVEHKDQTLRPEIAPLDVNFDEIDTVFIGFPLWWHEEPAVIRTLLDKYDFSGKKLYPFCTSYESPMSEPDAALHRGFPDLDWHKGLRIVNVTDDEIRDWINN